MSEGSNRETLETKPTTLSLNSNVEWKEWREGEREQWMVKETTVWWAQIVYDGCAGEGGKAAPMAADMR